MPWVQLSNNLVRTLYPIMGLMLALLSACGGHSDSGTTSSNDPPSQTESDTPPAQTPPKSAPELPPESAPAQSPVQAPHKPPPVVAPSRAVVGEWSSVMTSVPIVQVHLHLLPTGKVLSWGGPDSDTPTTYLWDPATGAFSSILAPSELFCSGHSFLPDGRLLVAGGHIMNSLTVNGTNINGRGLPNTNVFDPTTGVWTALPKMAKGRWYPTNTTLPSGEVLTIAGTDETGTNVAIPEIWNGTKWRPLTTASLDLPYYPRMFVAPDGRIFYAGEEQQSRYLDVARKGSWSDGPLRMFGTRSYGSAVMYEPGKILYVGGGDPPTNTAEIIDLNQPDPVWSYTGSMAVARRHTNATLLPTGDVLVTGGTSGKGFNDLGGAVYNAELWHPATGTWTELAGSTVPRIYHGTALLLPDGRVLSTGSGDGGGSPDEPNYEMYSPPYLFQGARPSIAGTLPARVKYGQLLALETADSLKIAKVALISLGSVTHAFDENARLVPLSFSPTRTGLSITFPVSRPTAPPGPYMLFLVNTEGVPSEGKILLLQ